MLGHSSRLTVCLAAFATGLGGTQPTQALCNVKVGDQVPAFSVVGLNGNAITKAAYKGKVLLLIFARPEQEKSVEALRVAQRVLGDNAKLAVLAISSKPNAAEYFKRIVSENAFTFPVALDPERKMYGDFGLLVSPMTLLIDGSGILRYEIAHMPANYERRLRMHVDQALGKISREEHDALLARLKEGQADRLDPIGRRLRFAQALVEDGKFAEAIPLLTKLRSEKDSALAAALLGTAYLGLDKVDEAGKCLDPMADTTRAPPELKLALARLEIHRRNYGKAESHLLEALETSPEKGVILFELGRLYERQGQPGKAIECYRKALEETYGRRP